MKPTRCFFATSVFCFLAIFTASADGVNADDDQNNASGDMAVQFAKPPKTARPWVYWFWLNGNITREGITADLEAMQRVGIGGVLIMEVDQGAPVGSVAFMSSEWRSLFKHVVAEAQRLGLEVNMNDDAGWNGSGGPWIKPEQSMQHVVWTETPVEGGRRFDGALAQPKATADFYRDIAVFAVPADAERIENLDVKTDNAKGPIAPKYPFPSAPKTSKIVKTAETAIPRDRVLNLTAKMKDGRLVWDAPAGRWTVLRIGHTCTGMTNNPSPKSGRGLECDKLSREGIDAQFAGMIEKLADDNGIQAGRTSSFVATHVDSWENGTQNWTARMPEEFRRLRGYDMTPYLPVMTGRVIESRDVSERFLWDLRKTISDLIVENYAGRLQTLAHQRGLRLTIEAYGGPCDDLTYAGRADEPMGEFWVGSDWGGSGLKAMTSAAHIYGKTIVGAESFTSVTANARWTNHPYSLKALGDKAFCEGINRFVFHRYAMQPWLNVRPGMQMGPWGVHYERTETCWEQTGPWHKYLARCNAMLRQGRFAADICYLQSESPNAMSHFAHTAYDFDGCSPEALMTRMSVRDGRLVLPDGMSYRVLVLPPGDAMTPQLLAKIKTLVEAGATVVGPRPKASPSLADYPQCDADVQRLAQELWGDCDGKKFAERRVGKGKIVCDRKPEEVLAAEGVPPDFSGRVNDAQSDLHYIHRIAGDVDLYFVAHGGRQPIEAQCTFRIQGKRPEFWRPDTGRIEPATVYRETNNGVELPIHFDPSGSVFVVFRSNAAAHSEHAVDVTRDGRSIFAPIAEKIVIDKAVYGVPGDARRTRDVTEQVRQLAAGGVRVFRVATMAQSGDPAPNIVKTLKVEFAANGKHCTAKAKDPESIFLSAGCPPCDAELHCAGDGALQLESRRPGQYEIKMASGKTTRIDVPSIPQSHEIAGPWQLQFPADSGAPRQITLDRLISWSDHADADVKYFSGRAVYEKAFHLPSDLLEKNRRILLDLGDVQVIAQVKLNGHDFGILWKPSFKLDVTDALKPGENRLEVGAINLWPNRLIGDEQLPEDCRRWPEGKPSLWGPAGGNVAEWPQWLLEGKPSPTGRRTFCMWKLWHKDDPLLKSGLLGPVTLQAAAWNVVQP